MESSTRKVPHCTVSFPGPVRESEKLRRLFSDLFALARHMELQFERIKHLTIDPGNAEEADGVFASLRARDDLHGELFKGRLKLTAALVGETRVVAEHNGDEGNFLGGEGRVRPTLLCLSEVLLRESGSFLTSTMAQ